MLVNYYPLIRGLASYVLPKKMFIRPGTGGTFSSKYCYSVWLRHLHYLTKNKLVNDISRVKNVAEIGPGDSLGIGLSALYSGAEKYYAFDVIEHAKVGSNLVINEELRDLFKRATSIPHGSEFQQLNPPLEDHSFPGKILNYDENYYNDRNREIKNALLGLPSDISVTYIVPWHKGTHNNIGDIDIIFSQAVMEHVEDIGFAYSEMFKWLKKGGVISHQVDFKTHKTTKEWNGHWFIKSGVWRILAHGRKYPMNRLPFSSHIDAIETAGFTIRYVLTVKMKNSFTNRKPKVDDVFFSDEDMEISSALIQAVKL